MPTFPANIKPLVCFIGVVIICMLPIPVSAALHRLYLGCPDGIYLSSQNSETGALQPANLVANSKNASFLAVDRTGRFLYSVSEQNPGSVHAWRIGPDGALTPLNQQPTGGTDPCHLSITPSGRVLLVANYSSGSVAVFQIEKDGFLSEMTAFVQLAGHGSDPKRQTGPHAHGVYCDFTENWVYVTDLGTDKVWIYRLDAASGRLTPNDPAFAALPPGSGPRHLAFGIDGRHAYINGEMGLGLTTLAANPQNGGLTPLTTIPVLPSAVTTPADTAEVILHPDGKTLYVSTRGTTTLSRFHLAPDGLPELQENTALPIDGPRHFALSPNGKWMILAGQNSSQLTVFSIDPKNDAIHPTDLTIPVNQPTCVVFAPVFQPKKESQ